MKNLPKLRAAYLDPAAVAAGAASNPLYNDNALAAREALRTNPHIVGALDRAWLAFVPPGQSVLWKSW